MTSKPKKRLGRKGERWEYLTIIAVKRLTEVIIDRIRRKPDTRKEILRAFTSFKRRVREQLVYDR